MSQICIAKILTAHGVRGLVKIDCYLEDAADLSSYNPLNSADGRAFHLTIKNALKGKFIAEIEGIADRTEAEKFRNIELFTARENLPDAEDGVYIEDMTGLEVRDLNGSAIGRISSVENFGAGDLLYIQFLSGKSFYLPYAAPYVLETDTGNKFVVVDRLEDFAS